MFYYTGASHVVDLEEMLRQSGIWNANYPVIRFSMLLRIFNIALDSFWQVQLFLIGHLWNMSINGLRCCIIEDDLVGVDLKALPDNVFWCFFDWWSRYRAALTFL